MSYKNFIKDVAIIGITQILINLSGFALLPIITKTLGAFNYGIWAQLSVTVSLLTAVASLGLSMAFVRFFSSKTDKKEISRGFFSIFFFLTIFSFLICSILFVFSESISIFLFQTSIYAPLIQIISFLIVLNPLYTLVLFYFRIYRKMLIYSGLTFFASIGQMALTIVLLLFFGYGLNGVIFSTLISSLIPLVIGLSVIIKQVGYSLPSFSEMTIYLRFSLPLAPNSIIMWTTQSSDRYIIGFFLGVSSVGVYSASYGIGSLISFFVMPLQMILFPQLSTLYDNGEIEEVKTYISYSMKFFLLISIPSVVGLTVLSKQILVLLTTTEFTKGSSVIPLIAASALFAGLFQIIINITLLYKKTKYNFWILVFSALLNVGLNVILIPPIGIIGAAIASLFSYILMFIVAYNATSKYLRFKIDMVFILKIILSSILMGLIVMFSEKYIGIILQVILGIVFYLVLCYILRIFNKNEMNFLKYILFLRLNEKRIFNGEKNE